MAHMLQTNKFGCSSL